MTEQDEQEAARRAAFARQAGDDLESLGQTMIGFGARIAVGAAQMRDTLARLRETLTQP